MRKIYVLILIAFTSSVAFAQNNATKKKFDISGRAGDHFLLQLSSDHWMGAPDSISSRIKGSSRGINVYVMLDKPFKSNPHFSVAFGLGIGSSNIFLDKMNADITGRTPVLKFNTLDTVARFNKYKISTTYAEIPLELRYFSNPENPNKAIKVAIGVKIGTLINAHTKGKTLVNAAGTTTQDFSNKERSKSYFNNTKLAATARLGYGNYSLFGSYNFTSIFKDNVAADMKLFQVGLTISGL
jgi:hypothetical protein